ncbi:unnamed protein product [Arctogadus glacialis]
MNFHLCSGHGGEGQSSVSSAVLVEQKLNKAGESEGEWNLPTRCRRQGTPPGAGTGPGGPGGSPSARWPGSQIQYDLRLMGTGPETDLLRIFLPIRSQSARRLWKSLANRNRQINKQQRWLKRRTRTNAFSGRNGDGGESDQASKKWENLKKKYKDLRTPKTGVGD